MTEKQFIIIDKGFDFLIRDTFTNDEFIDADGVCDVLNDYEEENEQLKKQIEELKVDLKMAKIDGAIDRMAQRPIRW